MQKQKTLKIISVLLLGVIPFLAIAQSPDPAFTPDKLIEDKVFSDTQTFGGAEGIQKFLTAKNSVLANTSQHFIAKLKEPQSAALKQSLDDPNPNLGRLRTAAELICDASRQSATRIPGFRAATIDTLTRSCSAELAWSSGIPLYRTQLSPNDNPSTGHLHSDSIRSFSASSAT